MKTIDFWTAIEWICEECGTNNYSSMMAPELSKEDQQEIREGLDIEAGEKGELLWAPETVTYYSCKEQFKLNTPDAPEEDEPWKS